MKPAEMPIGSRNPVAIAAKNALIGTPIGRKHSAMPRVRPARFVHVVYRTRQFDKMIAWYQAVFDCKVQYQNPVLAFLTYDDEHHRVAISTWPPCSLTQASTNGAASSASITSPTPTVRSRTCWRTTLTQGKGHRALLVRASRHHHVDVLRRSGRQSDEAAGRRLRVQRRRQPIHAGAALRGQSDRRRVRSG
jgi:catechol-2,3-dioxygenase